MPCCPVRCESALLAPTTTNATSPLPHVPVERLRLSCDTLHLRTLLYCVRIPSRKDFRHAVASLYVHSTYAEPDAHMHPREMCTASNRASEQAAVQHGPAVRQDFRSQATLADTPYILPLSLPRGLPRSAHQSCLSRMLERPLGSSHNMGDAWAAI